MSNPATQNTKFLEELGKGIVAGTAHDEKLLKLERNINPKRLCDTDWAAAALTCNDMVELCKRQQRVRSALLQWMKIADVANEPSS